MFGKDFKEFIEKNISFKYVGHNKDIYFNIKENEFWIHAYFGNEELSPDTIEDNMIIRKNGSRYIMVVECQGINYDLMSGIEKNSVEQSFLQVLNTLRYPIQLYIQTRTVNLRNSINIYKQKV